MKILFISLGCDKNLVDTETMLGYLTQKGYEITDDETEAEAVVVNTCCFIHDAKQESVDEILAMAELRKSGQLKALIVTGCLAQRYSDEIQEEIPEVDVIMGTQAIEDIVEALEGVLVGEKRNFLPDIDKPLPKLGKRMITTGGHYAYLKIAEGCDKHCTYCVIPKVRGKYRSVPMEELVEQAQQLSEDVGVKELILVAQETT
ncbi:MAG: radical SAM protein, partial [Lachnospiraceae bacterium]|nr:radical SAM protein [Lachnospiraceae bacterium]